MRARALGRFGLLISELGLSGGWQRGEGADAFLGKAMEAGVNFIAGAELFASEEPLGHILGPRRKNLIISM